MAYATPFLPCLVWLPWIPQRFPHKGYGSDINSFVRSELKALCTGLEVYPAPPGPTMGENPTPLSFVSKRRQAEEVGDSRAS